MQRSEIFQLFALFAYRKLNGEVGTIGNNGAKIQLKKARRGLAHWPTTIVVTLSTASCYVRHRRTWRVYLYSITAKEFEIIFFVHCGRRKDNDVRLYSAES